MNPPSTIAKAVIGMLAAVAGSIGATFPNSTIGKIAVVVAAGLAALTAVYLTKNTATLGSAVAATGAELGAATALTGAAAGTVVAGTTGLVGTAIDATIGRLIPKAKPKHKAGTDPGPTP